MDSQLWSCEKSRILNLQCHAWPAMCSCRSRHDCSAASTNRTPLAPSARVKRHGASSTTGRMKSSHWILKPLSSRKKTLLTVRKERFLAVVHNSSDPQENCNPQLWVVVFSGSCQPQWLAVQGIPTDHIRHRRPPLVARLGRHQLAPEDGRQRVVVGEVKAGQPAPCANMTCYTYPETISE